MNPSDLLPPEATRDGCHLVDSIACLATPASGNRIRTRCFACGEFTCRNCLIRIAWHHQSGKWVCHECVRSKDPFDARVYVHLYQLAGYSPAQAQAASAIERKQGIGKPRSSGPPYNNEGIPM